MGAIARTAGSVSPAIVRSPDDHSSQASGVSTPGAQAAKDEIENLIPVNVTATQSSKWRCCLALNAWAWLIAEPSLINC